MDLALVLQEDAVIRVGKLLYGADGLQVIQMPVEWPMQSTLVVSTWACMVNADKAIEMAKIILFILKPPVSVFQYTGR